ncbi:MAG: hypothetical protein HY000_19425 [Planctomycetes bacterium]|nr:hypothetical protein [Planctomycetota bacterium]
MVSLLSTATSALAAAEGNRPLIERLDVRSRIAVLSAILGILFVGILMVVLIALGGRFVRRLIRRRPRSVPPIGGAGRHQMEESD